LNPDTDIVWSAGPAATDVLAMLQSGTFEAVQTADGYGALLEVTGQARMVAMNNMPPSENNFCCACIMMGNTVELDKPRAAAITRAMMRGSAWAEENRSETAELMRYSMTTPRGRDLSQQDMKAALAMQAFVPMAEAARPMLVDEFAQYIAYGLPVDNFTDATDLVNRIFVPVTDELAAT
jgi:ABC-type nitrate/sulfonate/bicarbonate transport system substrate-binding protein